MKRIFQISTGKILLLTSIPVGKTAHVLSTNIFVSRLISAKTISDTNREIHVEQRQKAQVTLKFCPDHYSVYFDEVIPSMPFKYKLMTKIALKIGAVVIQKIPYMQSDQCFYCKFGSGGFDRKNELPPI